MNRKRLLQLIFINEYLDDDLKQLETKRKRLWCQKRFLEREQQGLSKELAVISTFDLENRLRITQTTYKDLLNRLKPLIEKQNTMMRCAISANERLSTTLYFLASGTSFENVKSVTGISSQSIGIIVMETCLAINRVLKNLIKTPTTEDEWKFVAKEFEEKWNFPNCIGVIDGKHVKIKKPHQNSAQYYNHIKQFSIIMMGIVNANYEFIVGEMVGGGGQVPVKGIHSNSKFYEKLTAHSLHIHERKETPSLNGKMPFVFVCNDAFPHQADLLRPLDAENLTVEMNKFNYMLSRVAQVSENAFGIISSRFRLLLNQIKLEPEKASIISNAILYLHNFFIKNNPEVYLRGSVDIEDSTTGEIQWGDWRDEEQQMLNLQPSRLVCLDAEAERTRNKFIEYFNDVRKV